MQWVDFIVGQLWLNSMPGTSAATFGDANCSVNMNLIGTWYFTIPFLLQFTAYYKEIKVEERKYMMHTVLWGR